MTGISLGGFDNRIDWKFVIKLAHSLRFESPRLKIGVHNLQLSQNYEWGSIEVTLYPRNIDTYATNYDASFVLSCHVQNHKDHILDSDIIEGIDDILSYANYGCYPPYYIYQMTWDNTIKLRITYDGSELKYIKMGRIFIINDSSKPDYVAGIWFNRRCDDKAADILKTLRTANKRIKKYIRRYSKRKCSSVDTRKSRYKYRVRFDPKNKIFNYIDRYPRDRSDTLNRWLKTLSNSKTLPTRFINCCLGKYKIYTIQDFKQIRLSDEQILKCPGCGQTTLNLYRKAWNVIEKQQQLVGK